MVVKLLLVLLTLPEIVHLCLCKDLVPHEYILLHIINLHSELHFIHFLGGLPLLVCFEGPNGFELMIGLSLGTFVGLLQELRLGAFVSKIILLCLSQYELISLLLKSVFKQQVGELSALLYLLNFAEFFPLKKLNSNIHLA